MLYGGGGKDNGSGGGSSNQFKTSDIDTIVAEVQNVPGEDRCVLMLGYKDQMIEMFQVCFLVQYSTTYISDTIFCRTSIPDYQDVSRLRTPSTSKTSRMRICCKFSK